MVEVDELISLLQNKEKMVAMLAPSFPIHYSYPNIVSQLRKLGFVYVVEVAAGAKKTNESVAKLLRDNPQGRYITSPCASFIRFIRTKHPQFEKYLAFQADSPMVATAKLVQEKYPGYRPVFIGPCIVKKLEAREDNPDLNILVITYKELDQIITKMNIDFSDCGQSDSFDIAESGTRIYPFDGGLTNSGEVRSILKDDEIRIVSGWKNCESVLVEFEQNPTIRFVDVLFCEGGCINGPGITSTASTDDRKKIILQYKMQQLIS